ncbi:MAG: AAA family ATPase [Gammaproteobacteria bacterium]|nr:AAA family ATPase [Gammaproteobacteria bacterium]
MTNKFVSFHSMVRGSGKTTYMVQVAKALAEKQYKVLLMDGHIYESGGLIHRITDVLGSVLKYEKGHSLYELLNDHEVLRSAGMKPESKDEKKTLKRLSVQDVEINRGFLMPDVVGRIIHLPEQERIDALLGTDPREIAIKPTIDLERMFDKYYGCEFFDYLKEKLEQIYDFILIDAPVGYSSLSGILCGQLADIFLAIDVDNPAYEHSPSYQVGLKLAEKVNDDGQATISVKSVKDNDVDHMVELVLGGNGGPGSAS